MSATSEPWLSYIITWHTIGELASPKPCTRCLELEGTTWQVKHDEFSHVLVDPVYGDVWDLDNDVPLVHPHCRCGLEIHAAIDWTQLDEFKDFAETFKVTLEREELTVSEVREMQQAISTLRAEVGHVTGPMRELEYLFYRTISIMRRMGLPEDVARAMTMLQRMLLVIRMLHSAQILLERTTVMGGTLGLLTLAGAAVVGGSAALEMS